MVPFHKGPLQCMSTLYISNFKQLPKHVDFRYAYRSISPNHSFRTKDGESHKRKRDFRGFTMASPKHAFTGPRPTNLYKTFGKQNSQRQHFQISDLGFQWFYAKAFLQFLQLGAVDAWTLFTSLDKDRIVLVLQNRGLHFDGLVSGFCGLNMPCETDVSFSLGRFE